MIKQLQRFIKLNLAAPIWNSKGQFTYAEQPVFFPKNSAIFKRTMNDGIFEYDNFRTMQAFVKPNTEVFDIGANIGIMLIPTLKQYPDITLVAVEASPNNIPYLKKTHENSPHKHRWTVIDKAVFDHVGKIKFQMADQKNGAYDCIYDNKRIDFEKSVEIECTTIDTIWHERNKPNVSFIKIDIEGADLIALQHGTDCIKTCNPSILIEWNAMNIEAFNLENRDLWNFSQSLNYTIYALPNFNRVTDLKDLNVLNTLTENFLLVSNELPENI